MATEKFSVTTDTTDLEQMPKSTADAILANFKTTVMFKTGQPVRSAAPLERGTNEDDN